MKTKTPTPCDRTRKPTDHLGIHLAKRNEPIDRLAEGDLRMETMETLHAKETTRRIKNNRVLYLRHTRNPLEETELSAIISTITGDTEDSMWINSKTTTTTTIQTEINLKKEILPVEEQIPEEFHEFLDVFSEEKATRFPEPRQWDHKIEMKDTFVPKLFKTYNLTPQEQIELDKFLKENLEKGYIRPSQSPMASPFFFVDKKDGKLRPCQDYRYLNEHTIKNAYPLPLITELLDKLKGAKLFTKLDVRWGYNNV